MAFVITLYAREGIVMACDSRLILNSEQQGERHIIQTAVGTTDAYNRLFLFPNNIGVSVYGNAEINGIPVNDYLEAFLEEQVAHRNLAVDEVAGKLLAYLRQCSPPPTVHFHLAGYLTPSEQGGQSCAREEEDDLPKEFREYFRQIDPDPEPLTQSQCGSYAPEKRKKTPCILHVDVARNHIAKLNASMQPGVSWGGEADILARLLQPVGIVDAAGNLRQLLPHFPIPWQFLTLQDAIDFCMFAVRTTMDTIRYQTRPKTVGGPIDVLVITPEHAEWICRKRLHA